MHKTALKWWLIFVAIMSIITAVVFSFNQEPIWEFAKSSGVLGVTICSIISVIWLWKNVACLFYAIEADSIRHKATSLRAVPRLTPKEKQELSSLLDRVKKCKTKTISGWFWAEQCMSLGMVGTVVGFMMSLTGFAEADISNPAAVQRLIVSMGAGLSVALFTTIFGLIASLLIKVQYFVLENDIDEEVACVKQVAKRV